jgi:hypothetical protein
MKAARTTLSIIGLFLLLFFVLPAGALAQEEATEPPPPFTREQLTQMLAPIALYPDALLSQVLMASTYPIEVIEADRWIKENPQLEGESLDDALQGKDWDPSVKSICHFPDLLSIMSDKIAETTNLGNAFLAQEDEVMEVIQELRSRAHEEGNLHSSPQQTVIVKEKTIIIEPANPEIIYVPYYNPFYIYGSWWYPGYPPFYWGPGPIVAGVGIYFWPSPFFGFSIGWTFFDWPLHRIIIDVHRRPRFIRHDEWRGRRVWRHIPRHRRGVAYRDMPTARRFGQAPRRVRHFNRTTRGFPGPSRLERREQPRRIQPSTRTAPRVEGPRQRAPAPERQQRERMEQRQTREREEQQRQRQPVRPRISPPAGAERRELSRERTGPAFRGRRSLPSAPPQGRDNAFSGVGQGRDGNRFSTRGRSSRGSGQRQERGGGSFQRGGGGSRHQGGRR